MSKVYVITKGDDSTCHICGVTLDYEKAVALARQESTYYDEAIVEVWDSDTMKEIEVWITKKMSLEAEIE